VHILSPKEVLTEKNNFRYWVLNVTDGLSGLDHSGVSSMLSLGAKNFIEVPH
jgi:hypothetical protein